MPDETILATGAAEVLNDIMVGKGDEGSIFKTYMPKAEVGQKIFRELYRRFSQKKKGFFMDDNTKETGVLPQCHSLQAMMGLAANFGLSFDDDSLIEGKNLTVREVMDTVIEELLTRLQGEGEDEREGAIPYLFDATPYETNGQFDKVYGNVDTITWVITTFLQVLTYHAQIGEICKWEDQLVDVIRCGLQYLNDAFIADEGYEGKSSLTIGWNFTKDCEEPSLYYTYTVCECFLDFNNTFRDYLDICAARRESELYGFAIDERILEREAKEAAAYKIAEANPDPGFADEAHLRRRARFNPYSELVRVYERINDSRSVEGTLYGALEEKCKKVAATIWRLTQDKLADDFFSNNLHDTLTFEQLRMSTTSDVLFNTVYIINIMIDAGLHNDLALSRRCAEQAGEHIAAQAKQREYDDFMESCQLAIQKAIRTYNKLQVEGKEYIVDQFLVGFNERFDRHQTRIKELRKLRMRIFSLIPLLIHTNNVVGEFLIKYPQAAMQDYLRYILKGRLCKNGKPLWIWEADGFFSASNYYYINSLAEFYEYYERYEKVFIAIDEQNRETTKTIRREYFDELTSGLPESEKDTIEEGAAITELFQRNKNLDFALAEEKRAVAAEREEVARLTDALHNQRSALEDAVIDIVSKEMGERLPALLCSFLKDAAAEIGTPAAVQGKATEYAPVKAALSEVMMAMLAAAVGKTVINANYTDEENAKAFKDVNRWVRSDIKSCLDLYVASVRNFEDRSSALYRAMQDVRNKETL